nr:AlpA family phage regulatory protein [Comamonas thiooxydans]
MIQEKFPHPIQLGPRSVGWVASQVHEWLEKRPVTSPGAMNA